VVTWKHACFWALLAIGTVGTAEAIVRVALDPPARYPKSKDPPMVVHDVRGYALKPGAAGVYHAGGRTTRIAIDDRGFRDGPYTDATAAAVRILAAGDSFTLGLGVESVESWPERLEAALRVSADSTVSVFNAGVPGYSVRQMRQTVQELGPELRPQVIVFAVNAETFWRMSDPYVLRGTQLIRANAARDVVEGRRALYFRRFARWRVLSSLDLWLNQHFELGAHLITLVQLGYSRLAELPVANRESPSDPAATDSELERKFAPLLKEIDLARSFADSIGASIVVLLVNPQEEDGSFAERQYRYNRIVQAHCDTEGIAVVDPLPVLDRLAVGKPIFRTADDYHWSSAAHEVAAAMLYEYLNQPPSAAEAVVSLPPGRR